jgi:hypothetical protein
MNWLGLCEQVELTSYDLLLFSVWNCRSGMRVLF